MGDVYSFSRDWGVYGWTWALGWFLFVLGILLISELMAGHAPLWVLLVPPAGAALMWGSGRAYSLGGGLLARVDGVL